jgi:uncharacterized protein
VTTPLSSTERTKHRRLREQGRADRGELLAVLAAGLVAHLGVVSDGWPMVVPTSYGFDDTSLYLRVADRARTRPSAVRAGPGPSATAAYRAFRHGWQAM